MKKIFICLIGAVSLQLASSALVVNLHQFSDTPNARVTGFKRDGDTGALSFDQNLGWGVAVGRNNGGTNGHTFRALMVFKLPAIAAHEAFIGVNKITYGQDFSPNNPAHTTRLIGLYDSNPIFTADQATFDQMATAGTALGSWVESTFTAGDYIKAETVPTATSDNLFTALQGRAYHMKTEKYMVLSVHVNDDGIAKNTYSSISKTGARLDLNVVPEPSTYALIGGCLALGFVVLRRRSV